jgi:hypothetical protein
MNTVAIGKRQNFEFLQPPHFKRDPPSVHGEDDWEARAGLILFSALTLTLLEGLKCRHIGLDYLWLRNIAAGGLIAVAAATCAGTILALFAWSGAAL